MTNLFYSKYCVFLLICSIFFLTEPIRGQVNLTSYHQFKESSKTRFNPAMYANDKFEIALMNVEMGFHSNIKYSDIIHKGSGVYADSLVLDIPKFRNAIGATNHIATSTDLTVFRVSFKTGYPKEENAFEKPHHISIAMRLRTMSNMHFDDDFITLFTQGNALSYSRLMQGSLGLNATAMREFSLSYGRKIGKRLWAGINLKYLQGNYNLTTNRFDLSMQGVDFENYIDVTSNAEFLVSGPVTFSYDAYQIINGANFNNQDLSATEMLFGNENPGIAADFGVVFKPTDKFVLSASVTDLGSIRWKQDAQRIVQNATYRYAPADLSNSYDENLEDYQKPEDVIDELTEEFKNSFKFNEAKTAYTQSLPYQVYLGAQYAVGTNINAGLVYTLQRFNYFNQQLLATSLNMLVLNTLSLSGNVVFDGNNSYVGLGGNLNIGALQISLALNNMTAVMNPANANTATAQLGLKLRL